VKAKEQVSAIAKLAEGVVVGTALVTAIAQSLDADGNATPETGPRVLYLVEQLASALRQSAAAAAL
jgi:tryptophan synthase alpha chain